MNYEKSLLQECRKEAKKRGIKLPHISCCYRIRSMNGWYAVYAGNSGCVWEGIAENANHAKALYFEGLLK